MRKAFTLMELLIVVSIVTILAGLAVVGLMAAVQDARASRTRAIIDKIDVLVMERWEEYRTKSIPLRIKAGERPMPEPFVDGDGNSRWDIGESYTDTNGNGNYDHGAAWLRLAALRELQRTELPDRISDLCNMAELTDISADGNLNAVNNFNGCLLVSLRSMPSLTRSYKRLAERAIEGANGKPWTTEHQGAECLYLILSTMKDHDKSALDYFSTDEIGDTDGDGMKEVLDGWGRPLEFLRWTPGYVSGNLANTDQKADNTRPDPFDPLHVDGKETYEIRPLIYSAGPDGMYEVNRGQIVYAMPFFPNPTPAGEYPNDPYWSDGVSPQIGEPFDTDGDTVEGWDDNISNHYRPE